MLLAELSPASFRGVTFYVPKDTGEEGRNIIHHQYPNSSIRYDEDNGGHAPTFKITALLFGTGLSAKLNRLRDALNKPGPGTLNHPYLGSWTCSAVGPYKYQREDEDSGVITLDLTFSVTSSGTIFPGIVSGIAAVVSGLAGSAVSTITGSFAASFGAGAMSAFSRDAIATQIQSIGSTISSGLANIAPALQLQSSARNLATDPATLIQLASSAMTSAAKLDVATLSPERLATGMKSVFDAGSASVAASLKVE